MTTAEVEVDLYKPVKATLTEVLEESPTIKTFVLKPEKNFSFKTGQFIELVLEGIGEAPFTPSSSPSRADQMEITIMNVGRVTSLLHACEKGQAVGKKYIYDAAGKRKPVLPHIF